MKKKMLLVLTIGVMFCLLSPIVSEAAPKKKTTQSSSNFQARTPENYKRALDWCRQHYSGGGELQVEYLKRQGITGYFCRHN